MANWLALAPPEGGPRPVEEARAAAQALADRLPEDREAINSAKQQLIEAEQADREALAQAMRAGREATSNAAAISAAREAVNAAERRHAARQLALADATEDFRTAIEAARGE